MGSWKEEKIVKVKMVLGMSSVANLVMNKLCTAIFGSIF
jgi:hypothetical protein